MPSILFEAHFHACFHEEGVVDEGLEHLGLSDAALWFLVQKTLELVDRPADIAEAGSSRRRFRLLGVHGATPLFPTSTPSRRHAVR